MTTAHRPTWRAAVGGEEQGGMRIFAPSRMTSAKDQAGQTKMKYRKDGQNSLRDLNEKDMLGELEKKERDHLLKKTTDDFDEERMNDLKLLEASQTELAGAGLAKVKPLVPKALDADDADEDADDSSDDSSDGDDDEDDEAELLAELERIKQERSQDAAKKAAQEAAVEAEARTAELVGGNPLLGLGGGPLAAAVGAGAASFQVKRRWDDDVVFKNQARGEPKAQRRFINDTIRSDFHRRFLNRYIK